MMFMNEYEIESACRRFENHPVLGPAALTLRNLMECANNNSDGWAYWPKPARAAKQLMQLIQGDSYVTAEQVTRAYRPIKSFLTRSGLSCEIEVPS